MVVMREFQNGDQPRTSFVKNDKDRSGCRHHHILNRWENYFCQPLNMQEVNVRQSEIHAAASLAETATGELKRYKSPDIAQLPAELTQAGGEILNKKF
jgi:hypothetical protein